MRPRMSCLWLGLAIVLRLADAQAQTAPPLADLTGPWQLLVDDYLISSQSGVVRTYHPFQKYAANPVMTTTKAWEGSTIYVYGTVLPNESGSGYRMWYHCLPTTSRWSARVDPCRIARSMPGARPTPGGRPTTDGRPTPGD